MNMCVTIKCRSLDLPYTIATSYLMTFDLDLTNP